MHREREIERRCGAGHAIGGYVVPATNSWEIYKRAARGFEDGDDADERALSGTGQGGAYHLQERGRAPHSPDGDR